MPKVVDHAERRDQVAAVAEQVIADRGLGASLRDVAFAGGWSTSVVTHYFATKDELLEHTLQRTVEGVVGRIDARVAGGESRLAAILQEILPLDARRRRQWRIFLAFWGRAVHDEALERQQRRRQRAFHAGLAEALAEAFGGAKHDLELETRRLFALVDGVSVQATFEPREWPARLQIELVERHLGDLGLPPVLAIERSPA